MERQIKNNFPEFDSFDFQELRDRSGMRVVPALIINDETGKDLGLVYMNRESYELTRQTGELTLWTRSRSRLWKKGETSGNIQYVKEIKTDCESNMLRVFVEPSGPFCHRGTESCFDDEGGDD